MPKLVYLASPYNNKDWKVRENRYECACMAAGELFMQGKSVFSPIAHSHGIARYSDLPKGFDTWKEWNMLLLSKCDALYVLTIDGWRGSRGVQAEIEEARRLGMPITYIDVQGREVSNVDAQSQAG